jgi:hypothetical protein
MPSVCNSCKQEILWAKTENGRSMPIDPKPIGRGTLELTVVNADYRVRVVPKEERKFRGDLYRSHFASCPFAEKHRKESK